VDVSLLAETISSRLTVENLVLLHDCVKIRFGDENLVKYYEIKGGLLGTSKVGAVRAVDGVSFTIKKGETLGLVGESGCGKTTLGKVLLRLIPATSGQVYINGTAIFGLSADEMKPIRRDMQIVFQDPYSSLNPRMTVGEIIARHQPVLAICSYHRQDHVWRIPRLIHSLHAGYHLFLRPHVMDVWDLVCYAIPEGRLS
jgi:ABC-type glutathione transport system ATPase component